MKHIIITRKNIGVSMLSERYTVFLFGIDSKYYTNEYVAYLWEQSANSEYENSGIFVTALIDINRLVCGEIRGCVLGETAHVITSTRNPAEVQSEEEYYTAFINVVSEVRQRIGNPNMTLIIERVEFYFFTQP
jgi:hypothetical protein